MNEYIQWAADIIRTTINGRTTFRQPPRIIRQVSVSASSCVAYSLKPESNG